MITQQLHANTDMLFVDWSQGMCPRTFQRGQRFRFHSKPALTNRHPLLCHKENLKRCLFYAFSLYLQRKYSNTHIKIYDKPKIARINASETFNMRTRCSQVDFRKTTEKRGKEKGECLCCNSVHSSSTLPKPSPYKERRGYCWPACACMCTHTHTQRERCRARRKIERK